MIKYPQDVWNWGFVLVHVNAIVVHREDVLVFAWSSGVPRQESVQQYLKHYRKQSKLSFYITAVARRNTGETLETNESEVVRSLLVRNPPF